MFSIDRLWLYQTRGSDDCLKKKVVTCPLLLALAYKLELSAMNTDRSITTSYVQQYSRATFRLKGERVRCLLCACAGYMRTLSSPFLSSAVAMVDQATFFCSKKHIRNNELWTKNHPSKPYCGPPISTPNSPLPHHVFLRSAWKRLTRGFAGTCSDTISQQKKTVGSG